MTAEDVLAKGVGVEFLAFLVVSGESLLVVGDVETTVRGTLQGTEDTSTSGSSVEADIKEGLERATAFAIFTLSGLGEFVFSIWFLNTSKVLVQLEFLEGSAGEKETGGVGSGPVGETVVDAVSLQLVSVGSDEDLVTSEFGGYELGDDVAVGESDDEAVFRSIVLVLGLRDQSLSCIVIGLSLFLSAKVLVDQLELCGLTLPARLRLYLVWKREK